MSDTALAAAIATILTVDVGLLLALVVVAVWRRRRAQQVSPGVGVFTAFRPDVAAAALATSAGALDAVPAGAYDRVVRVASWSLILSTGIIVSVTGLWPTNESAILAILAIAGLFVLIAHDVLPSSAVGRAKYGAEALVALVIVTIVVLLTGAAGSPFFYAYALVVAGAALVAPPAITVLLVAIAATGYLAITIVTAASIGMDRAAVAVVAINLAALVLLAYVAMVVGREQRRVRDEAIRLSTTDALTGLANRAFVMAAIDREIQRATRFGRGFCLLMADLDDLKQINDTYGHRLGDRVLVGVAGVIRDGIRRIDVPARLGGDEFVVLLPETDPTGAFVVAEKVRLGVRDIEATAHTARIRVSVSVGLVSFPDDGINRDELLAAVDEAMYASKREGKDRVGGLGRRPTTGEPLAATRPAEGRQRDGQPAALDVATARRTGPSDDGERFS